MLINGQNISFLLEMRDNSKLFGVDGIRAMSAKKQTFEEQLKSLENIVERLEKGELPLEDSLAQFEKGVKLTRECQKLLSNAEQKVAILSQDGNQLNEFSVD